MQLQISTTYQPATDLGYLLSKNPDRHQAFNLAFGTAHVFYPEATPERCSVALVVDVDPVGLVRGRGDADGPLTQYVNDRPYTSSSFLAVAIAQVFTRTISAASGHGLDGDRYRGGWHLTYFDVWLITES